jgi:hypothetical protein
MNNGARGEDTAKRLKEINVTLTAVDDACVLGHWLHEMWAFYTGDNT